MMKRCTTITCLKEKDDDQFYKDSRSKDGLKSSCKQCADERTAQSRLSKKEKYKKHRTDRRTRLMKKYNIWKEELGCAICEENFSPALELHHIDPTEKEGRTPSDLINYSWNKLIEEANKCTLLCSVCHRKVHHNFLCLVKE